MERHVRIKRDVEVEERASQPCDQVSAHGEQQDGEGEGHCGGSAPSDGNPVTHDHPQPAVFPLNRVVCCHRYAQCYKSLQTITIHYKSLNIITRGLQYPASFIRLI